MELEAAYERGTLTPPSVAVSARVLGPLCLERDGIEVSIGGPQHLTSLALLLVNAGESVSTAMLEAVLWDEPPGSAKKRIQNLLVDLRRALAGTGIRVETTPGGYRLDAPEGAIDAAAAETLISAARLFVDVADLERARECFRDAVALWRGPSLDGFRDRAFAEHEASRLDELRLEAVEELNDVELALGRHREIVAGLERLARLHPLREHIWYQLVLCLYRCGRQGEALRAYQRARSQLNEELGVEPGPELRSLEASVLTHDHALAFEDDLASGVPLAATRPSRAEPPLSNTTLIGRAETLAELDVVLDVAPVVTLIGPGGAGKTRLAMELARSRADRHRDGVYWCELAPVAEPTAVSMVVASAIGLEPKSDETPTDGLRRFLADRDVLLVLDNCEHVIHHTGALVSHLLDRCPGVTVLATSRESLLVAGERIWPILPLAVPSPADSPDSEPADSVLLFEDRARLVRPQFALNDENRAAVDTICRHLDGIPLAIELAAARISILTPAEIAERLDERFVLLEGGPRTAAERQRTLWDAIDWSYSLLDEEEASVFTALAVFAGDFDLAAATSVCALPEAELIRILGQLVSKSMLVSTPSPVGTRFHLLESMRYFAARHLAEREAAGEIAARHAHHFLAVAATASELMDGAEEVKGIRSIDREFGNLRLALDWALRSGDAEPALRLVASVRRYTVATQRRECWEWATQALVLARETGCTDTSEFRRVRGLYDWGAMMCAWGDPDERAEILDARMAATDFIPSGGAIPVSIGLFLEGRNEEALSTLDRVIAQPSGVVPPDELVGCLVTSMHLRGALGDKDLAREHAAEARAVARTSPMPSVRRLAESAWLSLTVGEDAEATAAAAAELLIEARDAGDRSGEATALNLLTDASLILDPPRQAADHLLRALDFAARVGTKADVHLILPRAVAILLALDRAEPACVIGGAISVGPLGKLDVPEEQSGVKMATTYLRYSLGEQRCDQLVRKGQNLTFDEVVAHTTAELRSVVASSDPA